MARGRRLETLDDYRRSLKNKYGLGEGSGYKPWLRVQDVPSRGTSSKIHGIKTNRPHHTLSDQETQFFFIAEFSDSVIDIREQFPLLPLDLSVKIAQAIDVDHPRNPKSKELNVITTDFLITRSDRSKIWYEAFNVKLREDLEDLRVMEKIDIERIWWELLGVKFYLFVSSDSTEVQANNISWVTDPIRHPVGDIGSFDKAVKISAAQSLKEGLQTQEDICNSFGKRFSTEPLESQALLKTLIAEKWIAVDLSVLMAETGLINITSIDVNAIGAAYECGIK